MLPHLKIKNNGTIPGLAILFTTVFRNRYYYTGIPKRTQAEKEKPPTKP
jgi:hypothetical protein